MSPRSLFGAVALALTLAVSAAAAGPLSAGHTEEVRGAAVARASEKQRPLWPPDEVFLGERLLTAANSRAQFRLGLSTTLRMGADASIRVDRLLTGKGGVVSVGGGPILVDKAPGDRDHVLELRGDFGLIAVRGTRIFAGPSNNVIGVFVDHGEVVVTSGGSSVVVASGQGTNIAHRGAKPTPPTAWGEKRIEAALASVD